MITTRVQCSLSVYVYALLATVCIWLLMLYYHKNADRCGQTCRAPATKSPFFNKTLITCRSPREERKWNCTFSMKVSIVTVARALPRLTSYRREWKPTAHLIIHHRSYSLLCTHQPTVAAYRWVSLPVRSVMQRIQSYDIQHYWVLLYKTRFTESVRLSDGETTINYWASSEFDTSNGHAMPLVTYLEP